IGTDEGPAITLDASRSGVTIFGAGRGRTVLKSASNKVEMFLQDGATDITFANLSFTNPSGALTNQVKPGSNTPGGGVAGLGNVANCAIREASGGGLSVFGVDFSDFVCSIHYIGDASDDSVTLGDLYIDDVSFTRGSFGVLA